VLHNSTRIISLELFSELDLLTNCFSIKQLDFICLFIYSINKFAVLIVFPNQDVVKRYTHKAFSTRICGSFFLILLAFLYTTNYILSLIQFLDEPTRFDYFNASFHIFALKMHRFVTPFVCMLQCTLIIDTTLSYVFSCVIYTPNRYTFDSYRFCSLWKMFIFHCFVHLF
jgi:hypothetical protein